MCERYENRSFEHSTGREVGLFMTPEGLVYENEEESQRIIDCEQKKFDGILTQIETMLEEYSANDCLRVQHEKGTVILEEGKLLMQEEKW